MLAKLLALLAETKGGVVAVVFLAGATTATVAATSPEVENTFQQLTTNVGLSQQTADCGHGQPEVVAQRNSADKYLRDAYTKDHKALEDLRGGPGTDNKAVGDIVRTYDDQLRDTLNVALNKVAALTLGREGQVRKAEASASPSASAAPTPSGSPSAKPSCSPKPSTSPSPVTSASPEPSGSGKPDVTGRLMVAERTTLDLAIQTIVDQAIKDMDDLVQKATLEAAAVPAPEHGKPSGNPGNKPENAGKPSSSPKH